MIRRFRDFSIRYKLVISFALIIAINAVFGVFSLSVMREMGELVNVTYDKALMSGTFAQAAKFNFAVYDGQMRQALLAASPEDFSRAVSRANKELETLDEDLEVVKDRALGPKSRELIAALRPSLERIRRRQQELVERKRSALAAGRGQVSSSELLAEWSQEVTGTGLYRKLTALYDDAAELGYRFRLQSEEKNQRSLYLAVGILAGCLGVSLLLSFMVAYVLILPLFRLTSVCRKVSQGDYGVRAAVEAKDEVGELASSFNTMLQTIQQKDDSIAALLEALPIGLFYVDAQGVISKERSPATDRIFANFASYTTLHEFYRDHGVDTARIDEVLQATFQKLLPFSSAVFLFPDHVVSESEDSARTVQITFRPRYGAKKKLERLIILAEDVTEKNQAIEEGRRQAERVERISKVAGDVAGFNDFLTAAADLFDRTHALLARPQGADPALARDLHSLKGLLGIYAFKSCAAAVHELESKLLEEDGGPRADLREDLKTIRTLFTEHATDTKQVLLLEATRDLKFVDGAKLQQLQGHVAQGGDSATKRLVAELDRFPVSVVFEKYATHATALARKLDDKRVDLVFAESDELSYAEAKCFDPALVHILNNSIDHGLETTARRREVGKSDAGQVRIRCRRTRDEGLELEISDDGKGIDTELLVAKAIAARALTDEQARTATQETKLGLIFHAGLSTKEQASEVSGRGVGMSAVKSHVEALGGRIDLHSELGSGTRFVIHLPRPELTAPT